MPSTTATGVPADLWAAVENLANALENASRDEIRFAARNLQSIERDPSRKPIVKHVAATLRDTLLDEQLK